jgi:hypothetical protein
LVLSLGMAASVAPLTTTVMGAVEERHAGIASGVNNAVARVAALLAIAVVGAVVSAQFGGAVERRLGERAAGGGATRAYVDEARERPLSVPGGPADARTRGAVRAANVEAFHRGMIVAGLLMIAGGLIALAGIENPRREELEPQPVAAAAA